VIRGTIIIKELLFIILGLLKLISFIPTNILSLGYTLNFNGTPYYLMEDIEETEDKESIQKDSKEEYKDEDEDMEDEDEEVDSDIKNRIKELSEMSQSKEVLKEKSELEALLRGEPIKKKDPESNPPVPLYDKEKKDWVKPTKEETPMDFIVDKMETEMPNYTSFEDD
jgi:DNA polymerase III alpha subunit